MCILYNPTLFNSVSLYSVSFSCNTLQIHKLKYKSEYYTLIARGVGELFFQLCCCVSFSVLVENSFVVTLVLRVQYSCGVVFVFRFWREQFLVLHTYLEYNTVVWLCQFPGCGGKYSQNENPF